MCISVGSVVGVQGARAPAVADHMEVSAECGPADTHDTGVVSHVSTLLVRQASGPQPFLDHGPV